MSKWCNECHRNKLTGKWESCNASCPVFGLDFEDLANKYLQTQSNFDSPLPSTYTEIEYTSEQLESDPEAIEGAKWDDMNYRHYMER